VLLERRMLRSLDPLLLFAAIGLVTFGILAVFSASSSLGGAQGSTYYLKRQLIWTVMGWGVTIGLLGFDYRYFGRFSRLLYLGSLGMLLLVMVAGRLSMGAQRWLAIGSIPLGQPSELAKVILIITLAKHLDQKESLNSWEDLLSPLVHAGIPMLLVVAQPDLGSTIIFAGILVGMLFFAGVPPRHLGILVVGGLGSGVLATVASAHGWLPLLKDYQLKRLLVFLNPYAYRHDAGWNIIQSMIAIGSGRFFGKGLFAGSQTQLSFLPARHTDFIFSVVGEEMGFLGAFTLLALYFVFLWRAIRTVAEVDNRYGRLLVAGVFSMFLSHLVINVGMSLGIMPVTGKPLPFLSYGGSASLANYAALGILFNVNIRRKKIHF
jgi:rod shape determining protein RodA